MSAAAGLLQGVHAVLAMRRGPHWLLNDPDAKAYGLALANALRHLPVSMAQKYVDFAALGVAVFGLLMLTKINPALPILASGLLGLAVYLL